VIADSAEAPSDELARLTRLHTRDRYAKPQCSRPSGQRSAQVDQGETAEERIRAVQLSVAIEPDGSVSAFIESRLPIVFHTHWTVARLCSRPRATPRHETSERVRLTLALGFDKFRRPDRIDEISRAARSPALPLVWRTRRSCHGAVRERHHMPPCTTPRSVVILGLPSKASRTLSPFGRDQKKKKNPADQADEPSRCSAPTCGGGSTERWTGVRGGGRRLGIRIVRPLAQKNTP